MLEARGIGASEGKLEAEVTGRVGKEEGVLVIRAIHVRYLLKASERLNETDRDQDRERAAAAIRRAFELHPMRCPVYRTLHRCIEITTELAIV